MVVGTLSLLSRLNEVQYFKWASTVKLGDFPPCHAAVSRWMFHVLSIPRVLNGWGLKVNDVSVCEIGD